MTEAGQGGRLAKINRALWCHQREVVSAVPSCLRRLCSVKESLCLCTGGQGVPEAQCTSVGPWGLLCGAGGCEAAHFLSWAG